MKNIHRLFMILSTIVLSGVLGAPTAQATEPLTEPPPVSEAVALSRAVTEPARDPLRVFHGSLARAGKDRILPVRARVDGVAAKEKKLPDPVSWGDDSAIATSLSLTVLETVCGADPGAKVTAWYPGGVVPDGRGFRTSEMMSDPPIGSEYVFWLERLDRDWFLTSRSFLLSPSSSRAFASRDGGSVSTAQMKGVCQ